MNTKLNHVQDWLPLAQQAKWSVINLAKLCGVSARTLERYFSKRMGANPKVWLIEQRQKQAIQILSSGSSVKETALKLGYRHAHHFSREFKEHWGCCPTALGASTQATSSAGNCRTLV